MNVFHKKKNREEAQSRSYSSLMSTTRVSVFSAFQTVLETKIETGGRAPVVSPSSSPLPHPPPPHCGADVQLSLFKAAAVWLLVL